MFRSAKKNKKKRKQEKKANLIYRWINIHPWFASWHSNNIFCDVCKHIVCAWRDNVRLTGWGVRGRSLVCLYPIDLHFLSGSNTFTKMYGSISDVDWWSVCLFGRQVVVKIEFTIWCRWGFHGKYDCVACVRVCGQVTLKVATPRALTLQLALQLTFQLTVQLAPPKRF